jgi:hypothetical protein
MDAVFFVFFAWTFYFLWSGRREHSWSFGILGGLAASLAAFFTFSAAILALWAVIVWLATLFLDRTHFASTTKTLFASAVAALCFYGILAACCGYHLIEVLQAAVDQHRAIMSGGGHETLRQHLHLTIANVVAFGFGSGVACVALPLTTPAFARENGDAADTANGGRRTVDLFAWCFAATLFLTAALPLYTLEVERIWLFFVPLLAISAVRRLDSNASDFRQLALTAFSLQAAQTGVMEVLLCTIW